MWNDDNNEIDNVLLKLTPKTTFPVECPICGKKTCHFYMNRFDEKDDHGSAWIWCSDCRNYSHFQYKIPCWWENCPSIDIDMLESDPDYLETKKSR